MSGCKGGNTTSLSKAGVSVEDFLEASDIFCGKGVGFRRRWSRCSGVEKFEELVVGRVLLEVGGRGDGEAISQDEIRAAVVRGIE